ncbi:sensor histidine kinase [Paenibacillus sp. GCM10012306]|uniref:sensor histidine kinase n=1 Tax=Paenibacillus sp. GCM10012306 TaxID=3317342 RepID=UPI003608E5CA
MKKRGVTYKLFIMTVVFFLCFYGMVILSQMLFFEGFYENQKISRVENHLKAYAANYASLENRSMSQISKDTAKFIIQNKSQLAILTLEGKVKLGDPFHITLKKENGQLVTINLSLFMNMYGTELKDARIQLGDHLTVLGENDVVEESQIHVLYPINIHKQGEAVVGEPPAQTLTEEAEIGKAETITGTVTEIVLPDLKTWNPRQVLMLSAMEEWFPLNPTILEKLKNLEVQQDEWTEPWTGVRSSVIIYPVKMKNGDIDLLFTVTSLQEVSETNQALQWFYVYLGIGGFILILFLSLFFSKIVTRPLISINNAAKRMVNLDFSVHEPIRQNDELGSLSTSMHTLSRKLDSALRELQEANQQLVNDMTEKQKMEIAQQEFFANASHELKTPISIIKGFAEGLQDGVSAGKQDHYIGVIIEESDKMEMLVQDMLNLATLQSDTLKLRKTTYMLSELVEDVMGKLVYLLKQKNLEAVIIPSNELPLYGDLRWMEQVVSNLVTNAIRHAVEGSTITIGIKGLEGSSIFSIENTGEQIPEHQLEHIWERFFRAEPSRSRQTGGTGLGLAIVKRILDLHGCQYVAENTGSGVRIVITFDH